MHKLLLVFSGILLFSCKAGNKSVGDSKKLPDSQIVRHTEFGEFNAKGTVMQGIPAFDKTVVSYERDGKPVLKVTLEKPVIVDSASKPEEWGYFQFPDLGRTPDNKIIAVWQMARDATASYGMGGEQHSVSADGGKTWKRGSAESEPPYGLTLKNGDLLKITTPRSLKVSEVKLPPVYDSSRGERGRRHFNYYRLHELPDVLQGVYLSRFPKGGNKWVPEHAKLNDPLALRYADNGLIPVVWWGDMRIAADGSIIAGIYPGFHIGEDGKVNPNGIFFYRSTDDGRTWNIQGRLRYEHDLSKDPNGTKRYALGFTEPGFEILKDGTFICVVRTQDQFGYSPMYISRSSDMGVTWSRPEVVTKMGVLPRLLQLDNGVVVMASGRPGMQLRFSFNGKGKQWTDPFEMLPYDANNLRDRRAISCGYPEIIPSGPDRFLLVYSDFNFKNHQGETRKAIKVREVIVKPL